MKNIIFAILTMTYACAALADGAMASDGSVYRVAANISDANEADKKAMDACKAVGGNACKIIARFTVGCWAISKDRQLGKSAPAVGYRTLDEAKSVAMQNCLGAGGVNCVLTDNQGCEGTIAEQPNNQKTAPPQNKATTQNRTPTQHDQVDCEKLGSWVDIYLCKTEEQKLDKFRVQCDKFGFQRGTNEYSSCMMQLQVEAQKKNPYPDLKGDVINNDSHNCVSTVHNNKVYTNCN